MLFVFTTIWLPVVHSCAPLVLCLLRIRVNFVFSIFIHVDLPANSDKNIWKEAMFLSCIILTGDYLTPRFKTKPFIETLAKFKGNRSLGFEYTMVFDSLLYVCSRNVSQRMLYWIMKRFLLKMQFMSVLRSLMGSTYLSPPCLMFWNVVYPPLQFFYTGTLPIFR